ncbi:glucosyltransferase domain-containing protein [Escherichia coli]|nr:glucosyltransferase domain-containing protein [Escherichia coli]
MKNRSLFLSIMSGLIILLPILMANRLYVDDIGRATHGYLSWDDNGRPLTSLIMKLITTNSSMIDVSPLPQLLGIILFCAAIHLFANRVGIDNEFDRVLIVAATVSTPIILENLSYRFDTLTMMLSAICFMIAPVLSFKIKPYDYVVKIALVVSGLSMYQVNISFYVIASLCIFISIQNHKPDTAIKNAIINAVCLVAGYIIYSLIIVKIYVTGAYSLEHSKIIELSDINRAYDTILYYIKMIGLYYNGFELYCLIALMLIAFIPLLCNFKVIALSRFHLACGITCLAAIPLALASVLIPISLLKYPVLHPRVLMPFSGFIFFLSFLALADNVLLKKASRVLLVAIIFPAYVFSFIYGNALSTQTKYEEIITSSIYSDLGKIDYKANDSLFFSGKPLKSPVVLRTEKEKPFISELLYPTYKPKWMFANMNLNRYGVGGRYYALDGDSAGFPSERVISSFNYDIYKVDRGFLINLK